MNRRIGIAVGVMAVCVASWLGTVAAEEKPAANAPKDGSRVEQYADDGLELPAPPPDGCCDGPVLVPVCRCVPTTRKKQKTEYDVKCEIVCVPGCSSQFLGKRAPGCCEKPCCDHATIRSKKTLIKKVVDEEEPSWEHTIEWVCADCETAADPQARHAGAWRAFHELWHGLFHRN